MLFYIFTKEDWSFEHFIAIQTELSALHDQGNQTTTERNRVFGIQGEKVGEQINRVDNEYNTCLFWYSGIERKEVVLECRAGY